MKLAYPISLALALAAIGSAAAAPIASHLTHYGAWKEADIAQFKRFGLVALQPGSYSPASGEAQAIGRLRESGTKVLLYISLGEDASTYNQAPPARGDGRGPVHWDARTGAPAYGNKGIASYYLDEWNALGYDPDSVNKVPDGIPDRQGDWGSCLVNAGDTAWQRQVLAQASNLMALGADGLFLDTPETPNPWFGYGWTAPGMSDLIRRLREALPGKFLLLNRGLFFFDPDFPQQYGVSPRKYVDAVMFESYYTGSNYTPEQGGDGIWRASPYFPSNKYFSAPRLNAEMNRPDSRGTVFHIDYVADPMRVAQDHSDLFRSIMQEVVVEQGWVPQLNDRLLSQIPAVFIDNPAPADRAPPQWRNTAEGSSDLANPPPPRVGALKAIPGNGKVTLRWDVASDQTWPVRYNVYYAKGGPLDFGSSPRLAGVATQVGADYTDRAHTGSDDGCPYEFTVSGLENNALYRFAVRAEDGSSGGSPATGRIGPGGGIEDANAVVLAAIPRDSTPYPIAIDGAFADWGPIASIPDSVGDGSGPDFTGFAATDDKDSLYVLLETAGSADVSKTVLLFNSDRRSNTGDPAAAGGGFRGADRKWDAGVLYRYQGGWQRANATVAYKASGNRLELRIAKQDLGTAQAPGIDMLAVTADRKESVPDRGLTGYSYTFGRGSSAGSALPPPRQAALPSLSIRRIPEGLRIAFANPRGRAEIGIQDLRGKTLFQRSAVTGAEFTWAGRAQRSQVLLIRVKAEGQPAAFRLWIP